MEPKEFVAFWDCGAFKTEVEGKHDVRVVGIEEFTDDNGYDEDEVAAINNLKLGETFESPDYGFYHWIRRIN